MNEPDENYCLGFAFNKFRSRVLLILKARPDWQAGKYNGLGGRVEPGEEPAQAMTREFNEEAGINCTRWRHFCTMRFGRINVYCYETTLAVEVGILKSGDEPCRWFGVLDLPENTVENVGWLVPMAVEKNHKDINFI